MTNEQFKDKVLADFRQTPKAQTIIRLTTQADNETKVLNLARYSVMLDSKTFGILVDDLFSTGNDWFVEYLKAVNFKQTF